MPTKTPDQSDDHEQTASKTKRLNLRLTPEHKSLLRKAAEAQGERLSEYVVRQAVIAAESDVADRTVFYANGEQFEEIQTMLSSPPPNPDKLAELLKVPSKLK